MEGTEPAAPMPSKRAKDADELQRMIEEDERLDQMELGKMSPIEYARAKGIQPQLVYYYIRSGHIKVEQCVCGRKVIDVPSADAYLRSKDKKEEVKGLDGG